MNCENCIHYHVCLKHEECGYYEQERPFNGWIKCSDRLPTADDGECVIVHMSYNKPVCEYVYIPWKAVRFEYRVGHIDAWFPIPRYEETGDEE